MRAVVDTVVFVRALMNPGSYCGRLLRATDRFTIVGSSDLMFELIGTIRDPDLIPKLTRIDPSPPLERILSWFSRAEVCDPEVTVPVCRDPNDDKFFACALAGSEDFIVSEDKDILAVGEYEGIRTVNAAEFLAILDAS